MPYAERGLFVFGGMVRIGIVVIGRNEALRLKRALSSVLGEKSFPLVYVDSASVDNSVQIAQGCGVEVVTLPQNLSPSAATARNLGVRHLTKQFPDIELIQFLDGDCILNPQWLQCGSTFMFDHSEYAAVCGNVIEENSETSVYKMLCAVEWKNPAGEAREFGGIVMLRVKAFVEAGAFDPYMIAAEDSELSIRLKKSGWKIFKLDIPMCTHDLGSFSFAQWAKRNIRAGFAFLALFDKHRLGVRHAFKEILSNLFWGLCLPSLIFYLFDFTLVAALILLLAYLVLFTKIQKNTRRRGFCLRDARIFSFFCIVGKWFHLMGHAKYLVARLFKRPPQIIEYKEHR